MKSRMKLARSGRGRGGSKLKPLVVVALILCTAGGAVVLINNAGGANAGDAENANGTALLPGAAIDGAAEGTDGTTASESDSPDRSAGRLTGELEETLRTADRAFDAVPSTADPAQLEELLVTARDGYAAVLAAPLADETRDVITKKLDRCNESLIFSPMQHRGTEVYVVRPGDTLGEIGQPDSRIRLQGIGLILAMNDMDDPRSLRAGQTLKLLLGHALIVVDKSEFTVSFFVGDQLVRHYRCGTGVGNATPEGRFAVRTKQVEPAWRGIPFGDPDNPLGTRWIGFADDPATPIVESQFGLHGTWEPERIPGECSRGCIRMSNHDIEELFGFVPRTTEVIIQQ